MKTLKHLLAVIFCICWSPMMAFGTEEASGTIRMEFDLSAHDLEETKLWLAYPISDENQQISKVRISGDYAESAIYADTRYSTPMLYARWDKGVRRRTLFLQFHVVRQEVVKKDFPAQEGAWDPRDYEQYLKPTSLGPIGGPVEKLAREIVGDKKTVYDKARAIYDWIVENMHRDPETKGCGSGDVCSLLVGRGGKCTDIHSVFVGLCRAAGIPAREVFGLRLGKNDVEDITTWQHCWAEFFLPGYGWVPVDPADVLKMMLKYKLALTDKRTKEFKEYFWGGWDAYRVKLAVGRDLLLNPPQEGALLNTFGYPYAEIGKKPLDWLDPKLFSYTLTYLKQ